MAEGGWVGRWQGSRRGREVKIMLNFHATSAIFVSLMCSLLPEDLHSELIL